MQLCNPASLAAIMVGDHPMHNYTGEAIGLYDLHRDSDEKHNIGHMQIVFVTP